MKKSSLPQWPEERNLETYSRFLGCNIPEILNAPRSVWIDIGSRTGKALSESRKLCEATLVGVNAHPIKMKSGIESIYATLPEDLILHKQFKRSATLVTDIYGAASYCSNPLEALIYESTLLKSGGVLFVYLLEERFADVQTWERVSKFYQKIMEQNIEFIKTKGFTNSGRPLDVLIVKVMGQYKGKCVLEELFLKAQDVVGLPKKVKIIFQAADKSAVQWKIVYQRSQKPFNF